MNSKIIETAERIVIDYANLSGRENANRAEFRERVIKHLTNFLQVGQTIECGACSDKYEDCIEITMKHPTFVCQCKCHNETKE